MHIENVTVNGNIIETNYGDIKQNLNTISEMDLSLKDLLEKLVQDKLTKEQSELLAENLAEYKNSDADKRKNLSSKISSIANTLVSISKASATIYPIAVMVFDIVKNIVQ